MDENKMTYLLYLTNEYNLEDIIFLGSGDDPAKLFVNALDYENTDIDKRSVILKWHFLVEGNLDEVEKKDLKYAFMCNPETEFSYPIKDMILYIKQINKF
jgi:nitrous oxide reductase